MMMTRRSFAVLLTSGLVVLAITYIASPAGASKPINPNLQITAISDQTPGANADITFRTTVPAGNHTLGTYGLATLAVPDEAPDGWTIAKGKFVTDESVTAVGTMDVTLDLDGDCDAGAPGIPQNYGPFSLLDQGFSGNSPVAKWSGTITSSTAPGGGPWTLTLTVNGSLAEGFTIDGFTTNFLLPTGATFCTPQTFTLTICGLANEPPMGGWPGPPPTVCGADDVVMTNPTIPGTYTWEGAFEADAVGHPIALSSDSGLVDHIVTPRTGSRTRHFLRARLILRRAQRGDGRLRGGWKGHAQRAG